MMWVRMHCASCAVEWSGNMANCWYCGAEGAKGKDPSVIGNRDIPDPGQPGSWEQAERNAS